MSALINTPVARDLSNVDPASSVFDVQAAGDVVNAQPNSAAHCAAWLAGNGATAAPLRVMLFGDSIATGIDRGPNMALAGYIGLGIRNITGTVTEHTIPSDGRFDYWINGHAFTFETGSSGEFTIQGTSTGDVRGDSVIVAYIAKSGGGSFDIETQANATGAWTKQGATVNTSNATTIGAVATRTGLSTSNNPYYRVRINNVVTASVVIVAVGIYASNGGGVIWMPLAAHQGIDLSQVVTTPSAVVTPIWTALAPKAVITSWADAASNWESGGDFRTFHATATTAYSATDWIVVSQNVTDPALVTEAQTGAQRVAQRAWALETGNTFINGRAWMPDWDDAVTQGLVNDSDGAGVHLTAVGQSARNRHIWNKVPLFQWSLGQIGGPHDILSQAGAYPMFRILNSANIDANSIETTHNLRLAGSTAGITLGDRASISGQLDYQLFCSGATLSFYTQGFVRASLDTFGTLTLGGGLIGTPQALSGAGAVNLITLTTALTSTGAAQALTLANGTHGQIKTIVHEVDGGSMVLTPTTKTGFTSITFTNAGESATLQYFTTRGWIILALNGAVAA